MSSSFGESPTALSNLPSNSFLFRKIMDDTTLKFRLFNCDRTFNLDRVEKLINQVAEKLSLKKDVEKHYFPLPRMDELCEELEKGGHFQYAVFVVHAHESRLSLNEKNAGIGYAKFYRTLQKVTDDRVLIVIGGDDNYKGQEERDKKVLSRWVWHKICSQFTEDYLSGVKSFIFSWEDNHHPIHEEALEFYLDPKKKGQEFVPRPRPAPARVPTKEDTKMIEPKDDPLMSHQAKEKPHDLGTRQDLKEQFPPERNENRILPSKPLERSTGDGIKPFQEMRSKTQSTQSYQSPTYPTYPNTTQPYPTQTSTTQPIPTHPNPTQPYSTHPNPTQPYSTHPNPTQPYSTHPNPTQPYLTHPNPTQPYSTQSYRTPSNQVPLYQASSIPVVHVLPFHSSKKSVDEVDHLLNLVYKQLGIPLQPQNWDQSSRKMNIIDHISNYKPGYLFLVSDFDYLEDAAKNLQHQLNFYQDIVKRSENVGTRLILVVTEDRNYTIQENLSSYAVRVLFRDLNKNMTASDKQTLMSWYETPGAIHKDVIMQLLSPYRSIQGDKSADLTSYIPFATEFDSQNRRLKYRAFFSYGRLVGVSNSEPPDWKPKELNAILRDYKDKSDAKIEFWENKDGSIDRVAYCPSMDAKLLKIAEGRSTDSNHSIFVYSYHYNLENYEKMTNFIRHLGVWCPCKSMDLASMMADINKSNPDYVMFSADIDVLQDSEEVKKTIQQYGSMIKGTIEYCVGKEVILMFFGDKHHNKEEFASKEVRSQVEKLTKDIVKPDKLTVMSCEKNLYVAHQNGIKDRLSRKGAKGSKGPQQLAGQGAVTSAELSQQHYCKAVISHGKMVGGWSECNPPDWKPDENIVNKKLVENKKEKKAYLEIWGNGEGEILRITVEKEPKGASYYFNKFVSFFGGKDEHPDNGSYV